MANISRSSVSAALLVIGFAFSHVLIPRAAAQKGCSCDDVPDLLNRYNEAQVAIAGYKNQIVGIKERDAKNPQPLMFTSDVYKKVTQPRIQALINSITFPGAKTASAETFADCKTESKAPTSCLAEIIDVHEGVHRTACTKAKSLLSFTDWKEKLRMSDFLQEEIDAYTAESNAILKKVKALQGTCCKSSGGWHGIIVYSAEQEIKDSQNQPASASRRNYKSESTLSTTTRAAVSISPNGSAVANASQSLASIQTTDFESLESCREGNKRVPTWTRVSGTTTMNSSGTGKLSFETTDPASFSIPLKTEASGTTTVVKGCPGENQPKTESSGMSAPGLVEFRLPDEASPHPDDPNRMQGTKTTTTPTGSVTVTWNLYRCN